MEGRTTTSSYGLNDGTEDESASVDFSTRNLRADDIDMLRLGKKQAFKV